jgi:hypothetical protein
MNSVTGCIETGRQGRFESGAKRAHSKTLARFPARSGFRKVLECVRFAPLFEDSRT